MSRLKAAVGITTYNRPDFAKQSIDSVFTYLSKLNLPIAIYNDGSSPEFEDEYNKIFQNITGVIIFNEKVNRGVAVAKNRLLRWMMDETDAEYFFLLEDDILIKSPEAVTGYIDVCEKQGMHHLAFAHHCGANDGLMVKEIGNVQYYKNIVGAWCVYTRKSIETVGYMDENFYNAWEHVEHTLRIILADLMPGSGAWNFPDAKNSIDWVEQIQNPRTSIHVEEKAISEGERYWRESHPDTYKLLWG